MNHYKQGYDDANNQWLERIEKIRTEIRHFMYDINPSSSESDFACNYILDIINECITESED